MLLSITLVLIFDFNDYSPTVADQSICSRKNRKHNFDPISPADIPSTIIDHVHYELHLAKPGRYLILFQSFNLEYTFRFSSTYFLKIFLLHRYLLKSDLVKFSLFLP